MKPAVRAWITAVLGFIISALCIAIGVWRIDWNQALRAFSEVQLLWVAAGAGLSLVTFALFARRWRSTLAAPRPPTAQLFRYLMVGYMTNAVLPMRPGDLARAALLSNRHNRTFSAALSTVVIERVFDLLVAVAIGFFATLFFPLPTAVTTSLTFFAAAGVAVLAGVLFLSSRNSAAIRLRGFFGAMAPKRWVALVRDKAQPFLAGIRVLHGFADVSQVLFWTVCGWISLVGAIACFMRAVGIDVPWFAAPIVLVITSLGAAIPSSPGALGVYHALFVFALSLFGVPAAVAVAAALIAHTTSIGLQVGLGALSSVALGVNILRQPVPDPSDAAANATSSARP
jgi:glycosyltransferase 2 family protein